MVLALTAADIGRRVVVRRRVQSGERPLYTDLLGELRSIDASGVVILTASAEVRVPLHEIHRAKTVPERRGVTAREVAALELAATEAWPPTELAWLGDWRLRAAGGYTGRANSALPVGDPGVPPAEAIERVVAFYRDRGLPPQVDVPLPLAGPVERELIKGGWQPVCTVYVQAVPLADLIAATPAGPHPGWTLAAQPSPAALEIIAGRRGPLPDAALHVLTAVPLLRFTEYAESGDLLAMARGSVTREWLGLFAIETLPAARRRGLARQAIGVLARWAAAEGARNAFLQVESTNTTAMALYAKLGFTTHHRYVRYKTG